MAADKKKKQGAFERAKLYAAEAGGPSAGSFKRGLLMLGSLATGKSASTDAEGIRSMYKKESEAKKKAMEAKNAALDQVGQKRRRPFEKATRVGPGITDPLRKVKKKTGY